MELTNIGCHKSLIRLMFNKPKDRFRMSQSNQKNKNKHLAGIYKISMKRLKVIMVPLKDLKVLTFRGRSDNHTAHHFRIRGYNQDTNHLQKNLNKSSILRNKTRTKHCTNANLMHLRHPADIQQIDRLSKIITQRITRVRLFNIGKSILQQLQRGSSHLEGQKLQVIFMYLHCRKLKD